MEPRTRYKGYGTRIDGAIPRSVDVVAAPPGHGFGELPLKLFDSEPIPYNVEEEWMWDFSNPKPPCSFKECVHERWEFKRTAPDRSVNCANLGSWGDRNIPQQIQGPWYWPFSYFGVNHIGPDQFPLDLELTSSRRWRLGELWDKLLPQMKSDMDLLVFLAELDDLPKLYKSLKEKWEKLVAPLPDKVVDAGKVLAEIDPIEGLKFQVTRNSGTLADNWLEYNFALLPLVSDLAKIVKAVFRFSKHWRRLTRNAGKLLKVRAGYREPPGEAETIYLYQESTCSFLGDHLEWCPYKLMDGNEDPGLRLGYQIYIRDEVRTPVTVSMTVLYQYELPADWYSLGAKCDAFISGLGVKPSLGTLWELIPFSFLVDYIYPIGSVLNRLKVDPAAVKTRVLDVCVSVKNARAGALYYKNYCNVLPKQLIGRMQRTGFKRYVGPDCLVGLPSFRWPNWFQLSIGAALLRKNKFFKQKERSQRSKLLSWFDYNNPRWMENQLG